MGTLFQPDNDTWTVSSTFNGLFGYGLAQMDEKTLWISGIDPYTND
jgi:hypothetical protein